MFSNVKKISRTPPTAKTAAPSRPTDSVEGWEELAALDACAKALASLVDVRKEAMEAEVLQPALISRGMALHRKPDSLSPVEGDARGSAYIAKRSTRSVLSSDDVALIVEASGIEIDEEGNVPGFTKRLEKQPAYLTINPDWMPGGALYDEAKLRKIERMLEREVPDFIVQVEPEAQIVVDDGAIDAMFKLPAEAIETIFAVVCGISMRPVFGAALEKAWEIIKPMIPEAVQALATSKSKKDGKGRSSSRGQSLSDQLRASLRE
jgi:hypothetical protein